MTRQEPILDRTDEDAYSRERHEAFSAPLRDEHRWNHRQRGEGPVFGMSLNRAERNQRLAGATLRNHSTSPRPLPEPNQTHDRLGLRGVGFPKQFVDHRRRWVIDAMQGRERIKDPVPELGGELSQICWDITYVGMVHEAPHLKGISCGCRHIK